MKEKLKNISNKKIVIITLCVMLVILILGFTYAYWTRTFTQTGINENLYECFEIEFKENVEGVSQLQGYPQTDEEGLKTPAYEVTIKNTCNTAASYNVILHKLNTSSLDDSHLKVAVDGDIRLLSETETTTNTLENAVEAKIINNGYVLGKQSKTIKVRSWMEENTSEEEGVNKSFAYKITIEATPTSNILAANILAENIQNITPNFKEAFPQTLTTKEVIVENKNYPTSIGWTSNNILNANGTGNKRVSDNYTYDEETGKYSLTDYITVKNYTRNLIGKYTCYGSTSSCKIMYKIKEVQDEGDIYYTENIAANQGVNLTSSANKVVGKNYNLDQETGQFILSETISNVSYNESYIGYYTCNTTSDRCTTMYKINIVNGSNVTNVDTYTKTGKNTYITKADEYRRETDKDTKGSGLYATEDDEGTSYYYRGNIPNNYVSFAGSLWRVMRINGDGSIRMIKQDSIGYTSYNSLDNEAKYVGYTYDNDYICTRDNPCTKESGTNSSVKEYIETWYDKNLAEYDSYITLANYCNDSKPSGNGYSASGRERMHNGTPTLKCNDTTVNYGGLYKLKVGLITADEMMMAGIIYDTNPSGSSTNYLFFDTSELTLTPSTNSNTTQRVFFTSFYPSASLNNVYNHLEYGGPFTNFFNVRPVINLKPDVKVKSGNGTKANPYVIE